MDPQIREEQYANSILYYINETDIHQIVVCDNSGFDYSKYNFKAIALKKNKEIEFLSFIGKQEAVAKFGKGFGEGEIMKYVINNSQILKNTPAYFKVTGRIKIKNINKLIKLTDPKKNFFHRIHTKLIIPHNMVDTRLYYCQKTDYIKHLYNSYKNVNDPNGYYLEHAYFDALKRNKMPFEDFIREPIFSGISGSTGISYEVPFIKLAIKQLLKRLRCI